MAHITISYASDFTSLNYNPYVRYNNPDGSDVLFLEVCIAEDSDGDNPIVSWELAQTTGSRHDFDLDESDMEALIDYVGAGNTGTVYFVMSAELPGATYYDSYPASFTAIGGASDDPPDIEVYVDVNNDAIPSQHRSDFGSLIIQGISKLNFEIEATAHGSASIYGYSTIVDGVVYTTDSFTTGTFATSGSKRYTAMVIDTNGAEAEDSSRFTVVAYSRPTLTDVEIFRSTSAGAYDKNSNKVWIRATREKTDVYRNNRQRNFSQLFYRYRASSSEVWSAWIELLPTEDEWQPGEEVNTYNDFARVGADGSGDPATFDVNTGYYIQLKLTDYVSSTPVIVEMNTASDVVAINLGNTGRAIGIGEYAQTNLNRSLSIGWDTYFDAGIHIKSGGTYVTLEQYIRSIINS